MQLPVEGYEVVYPDAELLANAARHCGWPRVEVHLAAPHDRNLTIAPRRLAWEGFARWADGPARLAAWDALDAWERDMQAAFADA